MMDNTLLTDSVDVCCQYVLAYSDHQCPLNIRVATTELQRFV